MIVRLAAAAGAAVFVLGTTPPLYAQAHPDLSGTWIVQNVDQQRPQGADNNGGVRRRGGGGGGGFGGRGGFGGGGRRGGGGFGGGGGGVNRNGGGGRALLGDAYQNDDRITLSQSDGSLIVTNENLGRAARYTFDGKESTNPGPGDSKIKSKAHWDGAALVVESTTTLTPPANGTNSDNGGREVSVNSRQLWSLNQDGTLRLENKVKGPRGDTTTTVTFRKSGAAQ